MEIHVFLFLEGSSSSIGNRRINNNMEQNVCICIIPNISDTKSTRTYENAQCELILTAPVAETSLVHYTASDVHCTANTIPSKSGNVQPECMAAIDKQFRSKGFSKKARELLSASWRKEHKKIIHTNCSVVGVVEEKHGSILNCLKSRCRNLADLFKKGFKNRTIAGYRSMLSSVLPPVENSSRWQHPYTIRFLKGVFNSRPPTAILIPAWDLPKVLDLLKCTFGAF